MNTFISAVLLSGILLVTACGAPGAGTASSIAEAEISSVRFTSRPRETHVLFYVDVAPKYIKADTGYFVALLSKDGYFLDSDVVRWSAQDLAGVKQDERDYWKIKEAEERLIKRVTLGAPANDKEIVALAKAYKAMVAEGQERYARQLQEYLQKGDLVSLAKAADHPWEPSKAEINTVSKRYVQVKVVDKEGLTNLQYPEGATKLIQTYSGTGPFTTPIFTATYDRLNTSWVGNPPGRFEYKLYTADGKYLGGTVASAEPDKKPSSGNGVQPGQRYYIQIIAAQEMQWTFWLEETNLPF